MLIFLKLSLLRSYGTWASIHPWTKKFIRTKVGPGLTNRPSLQDKRSLNNSSMCTEKLFVVEPNTASELCISIFSAVRPHEPERIIENYRFRRICTSHFRGWQIYVEPLLECGVLYSVKCTGYINLPLHIKFIVTPTPTHSPHSTVGQLITLSQPNSDSFSTHSLPFSIWNEQSNLIKKNLKVYTVPERTGLQVDLLPQLVVLGKWAALRFQQWAAHLFKSKVTYSIPEQCK